MNQRPPQPPHPPRLLDAEERALAKGLPRLHGRTMPGPDLDASILAAAQAAVQPARSLKSPIRPRVRWIAPTALAASMVLAVGMAWQLRPLPALEHSQPLPHSDTADVPTAVMMEPAPSDQPVMKMPPNPAPAAPVAPARNEGDAQAVGTADAFPEAMPQLQQPFTPSLAPASRQEPVSAPVLSPPPEAPPAPPSAAGAQSAEGTPRALSSAQSPARPSAAGNSLDSQGVDRSQRARMAESAANADAASDAMAREAQPAGANKAGVVERARQATPKAALPSPVVPEVRNEAWEAADAGFVGDPDEDVPPATAASPVVRDAWLQRIGELLEQGERRQAKASLAEFRRRYPSAVLPPRLRALEIEP